jgi:hypothetical protein
MRDGDPNGSKDMKRRWIIRSFFMLPIVLCIIGWGWSSTHWGWAGYTCADHVVRCGTFYGVVYVSSDKLRQPTPNGWSSFYRHVPETRFWSRNDSVIFFGFGCYWGPDGCSVHVPYLFPLFVFSLVLMYVWRITRPKPNPVTAFPVEMDTMSP